MAIIQRPTKQGNATTYQGKVAAGYTKILAAEVDADLDLIYSAWNQGVDSVNIQPGSITGDKLAPGAVGTRELQDGGIQTADIGAGQVTQAKLAAGVMAAPSGAAGGDLGGLYPNPSVAAIQSGALQVVPRGVVVAGTAYLDVIGNEPGTLNFDNTKPAWLSRLDYGTDDAFEVWRSPAPGTAFVKQFYVKGSDGKTYCTLADKSVLLGQLAVGASVQQIAFNGMATGVGLSVNVELVCVEVTWTSRGGNWFALAVLHGHVGIPTSGTQGVGSRVRIDGTAGTADGTIVAQCSFGSLTSSGTLPSVAPFALSTCATGSGLSAGVHRLKVFAYTTGPNVVSNVAESGFILVGELA
jgi:hypothetical protein